MGLVGWLVGCFYNGKVGAGGNDKIRALNYQLKIYIGDLKAAVTVLKGTYFPQP